MQAWGALCDTLQDGRSGFEHAHGHSVWDWLAQREEEGRTFDEAMQGLSIRPASALALLYPWREVRSVCDVGGGLGTVLRELLKAHPHLRGVLCDRADVLGRAAPGLCRQGLEARVALAPADFFVEVPRGAEAYLLKNVLHDWEDDRCLHVLAVCRRAAAPGSRVIIAEQFVEPQVTDPLRALSDVQMMIVSGEGRERSQRQYAALLERAALRPRRVFRHPLVDVMEAEV